MIRLISYTQPAADFMHSLLEEAVAAFGEEYAEKYLDQTNSLDVLLAYVARVSNPAGQKNHDTAPRLIQYLAKNKHWSPFEMVHVTFEIECPRDISRQILRHRSFAFQEFSQRYQDVSALEARFAPRECRLQDSKNRQNSLACVDPSLEKDWEEAQARVFDLAQYEYKKALSQGVAKEVARAILPEGLTPTRLYMTGSLRSWIHFCQVRGDASTQKETREIAEKVSALMSQTFPVSWSVVKGGVI